MGLLDGRAAVVTGGGRGIGRGHCLHLAEQGAARGGERRRPRRGPQGGGRDRRQGRQGGRERRRHRHARRRPGPDRRSASTPSARSTILVNNAGNVRDRSFLKMSDDDFYEVLRVHVHGTFLCGQEAALRMRDQGTGGCDREHRLRRALRQLRPDQLRRLQGRDRVDDLHLGRRARALRNPRQRDQPVRHHAHVGHRKIGGKDVELPFHRPDAQRRLRRVPVQRRSAAGSPARSSAPAATAS